MGIVVLQEETLGGLNIYASKNLHTSTGPVIVLIHDIWGHGSNNLRVMCVLCSLVPGCMGCHSEPNVSWAHRCDRYAAEGQHG